MFYIFLCIQTFTLYYFFRLINGMVFHGAGFTGDLVFVGVCLALCSLIVAGTLRIKHLNNEFLKKAGIVIAACGVFLFIGCALSFNARNFVAGLEAMVLLGVFGLLEALYQTMPEGEPDSEESELEYEDITKGYFEIPDEEPVLYEPEPSEAMEDVGLVMEIQSILESQGNDGAARSLDQILFFLNAIVEFGYEIRPELAESLTHIFRVYLELLKKETPTQRDRETESYIDGSLATVRQCLENVYHQVRGGMAFRTEKEVGAISSRLTQEGYA